MKKVLEYLKELGKEDLFKRVEGIIEGVKGGKSVKWGIVELYELGFYVSEISKVLSVGLGKIVSVNWCYNVMDSEGVEIRKKKGNGEVSKSEMIKGLIVEGKSNREIGEIFMKNGIYVNSSMIGNIRGKMVRKGEVKK